MKLLFYPTHPTATKPLTPSHVKMFLWFDLLVDATSRVIPVTTLANRVTCDVTAQNLGFWHYLDTSFTDDPALYADKDELWVAEQYVRYHAERFAAPPPVLEELRSRVEHDFWIHPASARILELWSEQCRLLGVDERSLHTWTPLPLTVDEALEALADLDVLIDVRGLGGGAYLDLTPEGIALRQLVSEQGVPNYVVHVLRELLAVGPGYDRVVLAFDAEIRHDFDLVASVLRRAGVETVTLPVDRVRLPGVTGTTRAGGFEPYILARIIERFLPTYGLEAFRLGIRMYYVLHVGRRGGCEFDLAMLERFMRKAAAAVRRLNGGEPGVAAPGDLLRELWPQIVPRDGAFVDPNRLLQTLFKQAPESAAARALARELLL